MLKYQKLVSLHTVFQNIIIFIIFDNNNEIKRNYYQELQVFVS